MAHWTENLEELCEIVDNSLSKALEKLRRSNDELSPGDAEYLDKLTHMLKSIKTTIAMEEYSDDSEYSGARGDGRGRGRNARRDSMGRYSRDGYRSMERGGSYDGNYSNNMGGYSSARRGGRGGYSRDDAKSEIMEQLREMEMDAKDEETRRMIQKWIRQTEQD